MTGLSSMQLAVEIATRERDQLRQELARAQAACAGAQEQFNQLEGYAQETQTRWVAKSQIQSAPEVMRHYYQFMDKLYHAIALQTQALQEAQRRLQAQQDLLLEAEFKLASRQTVRDDMRRAASVKRAKIEQKQFDEMAALQHRQNRIEHEREALRDRSRPALK